MTFNEAPSPRELLIVYIYFILYIVSYKLYHSNPDIVLIILIYLLCNIKLCFSYLLLFIRYTYLCSERVYIRIPGVSACTCGICSVGACAEGGKPMFPPNILCFPPNNGRETEGLFAHAQCDLDPHRGHIWVCLLEAPRIPEQTHVMIVAIEEGALTPDSGA